MTIENGLAYAKDSVIHKGITIWNEGNFYKYKIIEDNDNKTIEVEKQDCSYAAWDYSRKILVEQIFVLIKDI